MTAQAHRRNFLQRRGTEMMNSTARRHGFTLVEMLISVALTLMVVFALVRVFALLGQTVTDSRATMELSGSLRQAANLLRSDLKGMTVTTLPGRDPEQMDGYTEVIDGPATDSQHYVRGVDDNMSATPINVGAARDADGDQFLDTMQVPYDSAVGDIDDILAFTSRNATTPFKGTISDSRIRAMVVNDVHQLVPQAILTPYVLESPEAEILWWVQVERNRAVEDAPTLAGMSEAAQLENAIVGIPQRYPNGTTTTEGTPVRSLHRRVLLVRPDLDLSNVLLPTVNDVASFLSNNDLSVSVNWSEQHKAYKVKANSLGDLALRHNRACRIGFNLRSRPNRPDPKRQNLVNTVLLAQHDGELMGPQSLLLRHASMKDMVLARNNVTVHMMRRGRDVVVSDLLAFDLRVWDPMAVVGLSADGTALAPGDPGYGPGLTSSALGAFVDLGHALPFKSGHNGLPVGEFGGPMREKAGLGRQHSNLNSWWPRYRQWMTYCTWCAEYEHDGIDQFTSRETTQNYSNKGISRQPIDEGENGFDDDNRNGVDDPGELETSPPYPHPLRGLQVRIRVMDANTRQVRQTSVTQDFLPE